MSSLRGNTIKMRDEAEVVTRDGDGLPAERSAVPGRPMDVQYVIRGTQLPAAATIQEIVKQLDRRIPPTNMVLGGGLRLIAIGVGSGLVAALGATRLLRALLYEMKPASVAEIGSATTLLVVVTLCATLPARRAARPHPPVVLRGE